MIIITTINDHGIRFLGFLEPSIFRLHCIALGKNSWLWIWPKPLVRVTTRHLLGFVGEEREMICCWYSHCVLLSLRTLYFWEPIIWLIDGTHWTCIWALPETFAGYRNSWVFYGRTRSFAGNLHLGYGIEAASNAWQKGDETVVIDFGFGKGGKGSREKD